MRLMPLKKATHRYQDGVQPAGVVPRAHAEHEAQRIIIVDEPQLGALVDVHVAAVPVALREQHVVHRHRNDLLWGECVRACVSERE